MRTDRSGGQAALERVREASRQAAEEMRREQEMLSAIGRFLADLAEQDLALHKENRAVLDAVVRDLDSVQRQLKRLATARS